MGVTIVDAIIILLLIPFVFIYSAFSYGYCFSTLWGWYVVPLGFTPISLLWAVGITLIIRLVCYSPETTSNKNDKQDKAKLFGSTLLPWMVLLLGFINLQVMDTFFPDQKPNVVVEQNEDSAVVKK